MDKESVNKPGSSTPGSQEPGLLATSKLAEKHSIPIPLTPSPIATTTQGFKLKPSSKGVSNAKKILRAFSIQKKSAVIANKPGTPIKPVSSGASSTVVIGKLTGVKVTPKPDDAELAKRPPKPPKPGQQKRTSQDLPYTVLRKRTLSDIEDMKRKMELIELGIPLGLICPTSTSEKAMPTKAMPPIKSFLDPAKLDEIIREAKKAKAEGKEFKFDYQKLLPDYDNPFQRKKEEAEAEKEHKKMDIDKKKRDKYDRDRRHSSVRRDDKEKWREERYRERSRDKSVKRESMSSVERETNVNLNDYLVCDSWSLDNEDKTNSSSPKRQDVPIPIPIDKIPIPVKEKPVETIEIKPIRQDVDKVTESPKATSVKKIEKLQPVIDSFKYELDSNDDEMLDLYDDNNTEEEKYTKTNKDYDATFEKFFEGEQFDKDVSNDALTDDTFLEAVINEIKQESISDDEGSHDKGLVEYDSPSRDGSSPKDERISVTPELDDRMRDLQSRRSDYSDGYRSTESGYKSTESGYKSDRSSSYRISTDNELTNQMPKSTVDSLETWSFVLKICQPLLFRHDRNKCYRESRTVPKIWYTVNPKMCSCVEDRAIVYEELETCKMNLVDRVYGCDQILESGFPKARMWYPRLAQFLSESTTVPTLTTCEWEADDSQTESSSVKDKPNSYKATRSTTPLKSEEISLDREYQRFMEAVWPDVGETKSGTPRSTTPVKQEVRKKKAEETQQEDKKKAKKLKLSSEGWSQESDIEEESDKVKKVDKITKMDKVKMRKRKHSTTSSITDSDQDSKKRRKTGKKKASKKSKSKLLKRQRLSKKYLKKLKEKHKKKKKQTSEDDDIEKDNFYISLFDQYDYIPKLNAEVRSYENRKKEKKLKRKKLQKKKSQKKKKGKVKSSSSSSSSSTSRTSSTESSSDYESDKERKKRKKKSDDKKKRKHSSSDSTQSEDLFDENILNNIKTERLTDDENKLDFSRHKPREIINVKELQNDFVGSVKIKQEVEDKIIVRNEEIVDDKIILKENEIVGDKNTVKDKDKGFVKSKDIAKDKLVEVKKIERDDVIEKYESNDSPTEHSESISPIAPENVAYENYTKIALENIPIPQDACEFKEPMDMNQYTSQEQLQILPEATQPEESNLSLCSSQDSSISKDPYEKDDSHLRPSSQNSNYSFHDVINASQSYQKEDEDKFEPETYEGNYEMYEQLAMAYQSDVAKGNVNSSPGPEGSEWWMSQRIETVVDGRVRGEIKCDWRPGDTPTTANNNQQRPSRWGLKPGEVNIVLTEGSTEHYPMHSVEPVYQIETLANNRVDTGSTGSYDEAYEDMYGASDRLQYGDCFAAPTSEVVKVIPPAQQPLTNKLLTTSSAFEDRIDQALKNTVLGAVAKVSEETDIDKETPEKGILVTNPEVRSAKRVSFADGYKPGQDSDVEEPPKRKKKSRRLGCAWPCPATHPDHVPLWDALPPPPPPPGSPPPFITQPSTIAQPLLLQQPPPILQQPSMLQRPPPILQQSPAMLQRPPPLLQSSTILQQQPPSLLQQQPPPMVQQQQLMQQQLLKSINPAMLRGSPFAMAPKMDPNVSLPNFMPPEPPPGLISFQ